MVSDPKISRILKFDSQEPAENLQEIEERTEALIEHAQKEIASWSNTTIIGDKRKHHRVPHCTKLLLVPLDNETELPCGPPGVVYCKDLSPNGMAFIHNKSIVHTKVAVLLPTDSNSQELLVAKLVWCRFTEQNHYCTGAIVLRHASFPIDESWDSEELANW